MGVKQLATILQHGLCHIVHLSNGLEPRHCRPSPEQLSGVEADICPSNVLGRALNPAPAL
jgi:hypothetical protein